MYSQGVVMSTSKKLSNKSLWEYVLLGVSVIGTLIQVMGLISESQKFLSNPLTTTIFVFTILFGTALTCVVVMIRKKPGNINKDEKIPYYTKGHRIAAGILLTINVVISAIVITTIYNQSICRNDIGKIDEEKFGILIADFTEGTQRRATPNGRELADRTFQALKGRLSVTSFIDKVEIKRICPVENEEEAFSIGQSLNAAIVVWGNVHEFSEDTFEPSFTFLFSDIWPSDIDPILFESEINRVNNSELPSRLSARTTSVAAFIIGMISLNSADGQFDYEVAIREFSYGIDNIELELSHNSSNDEQELALKRTLAIFYVFRGRTYAALGDNENAISDYASAEANDPTYPAIYVALGNHFYSIYDFDQAETFYRKAIQFRDISTAYYGLGNSLFYQEKYDESIASYLDAIRIAERNGDDPTGIRLVLAVVYFYNGQAKLANEQIETILNSSEASTSQKQLAETLLRSTQEFPSTPFRTPTAASLPVSTIFPNMFPTTTPTFTITPTFPSTRTMFPTTTLTFPFTRTMFPTTTPVGP